MSLYEQLESRKGERKARKGVVFTVRLKPEDIDSLERGIVVPIVFRGIKFVIQKGD